MVRSSSTTRTRAFIALTAFLPHRRLETRGLARPRRRMIRTREKISRRLVSSRPAGGSYHLTEPSSAPYSPPQVRRAVHSADHCRQPRGARPDLVLVLAMGVIAGLSDAL